MLVALEGIDGSGKTSLCQWLAAHVTHGAGRPPIVVHWTSFIGYDAELPKLAFTPPKAIKDEHKLGPLAFSLWHCADFAYRWESVVWPSLGEGRLVIMDRYLYSALVRDVSRGVAESFVRSIYSFAPPPDLLVYLDVAPAVALERKRALGYYESGEDVLASCGTARTRADYFLDFQARCRARYRACLPADALRLDASRDEDLVRADVVAAFKRLVPDLAVR